VSRVLIVDDEPIIRRFLADGLSGAGFEVSTARNGAEALVRAREQHSDIVLLDLLMPVMDGITFLRQRQALPPLAKVPVVVLSAAGIDALRIAARLRATAVLAKPIDLAVLSTVIQHVLGQWTPAAQRCGVHSIDEALNSASLHRLWQDSLRCALEDCRHML
jgi:CheY-like chemotaxis protein